MPLFGAIGSAQATTVTVGSPLSAAFEPTVCLEDNTCTAVGAGLRESGAVVSSPVDGAVVRWRIVQGDPGRRYKLRVLTPGASFAYTATGASASASPAGFGIETFPTAIPVKAGQTIGIDLELSSHIGFSDEPGGQLVTWAPAIPEGTSTPPKEIVVGEIGFNADVQPRPTVTGVTPAAGSFKGGAPVTIAGTDFAAVSAVNFGTVPAKRFTVSSEGQVSAVTPPLPARARVAVSVTTVAGVGTSTTPYKATACIVPNLDGKKLKAVRKKLK